MDALRRDYRAFLVQVSLPTLNAAQQEFERFIRSRDSLFKNRQDLVNEERNLRQQRTASPDLDQQLANLGDRRKALDSALAQGGELLRRLDDPSRLSIVFRTAPLVCDHSKLEQGPVDNPSVVQYLNAARECRPQLLEVWAANLQLAAGQVESTGMLIDYFSSPEVIEAMSQ